MDFEKFFEIFSQRDSIQIVQQRSFITKGDNDTLPLKTLM